MKNYNDFLDFIAERTAEITYDTVASFSNDWKPTISLTQDDIALITKIAHTNCLAILRQYHNWLLESHSE